LIQRAQDILFKLRANIDICLIEEGSRAAARDLTSDLLRDPGVLAGMTYENQPFLRRIISERPRWATEIRDVPPAALTRLSGTGDPTVTFPDGCCFQVIYFVCSIFLLTPIEVSPAAGVETSWLTHAVKNAWADRHFAGFCTRLSAPEGAAETERERCR
jgi:hypothetical protein